MEAKHIQKMSPLSKNGAPKQNNSVLLKHIMCNNMSNIGKCPFGKKCRYAHSKDELIKKERKSFDQIICNFTIKGECCPLGEDCKFSHTIYTKPCREFALTGQCSRNNCIYQHMKVEQLCRDVLPDNTCPYGNQCIYVHDYIKVQQQYFHPIHIDILNLIDSYEDNTLFNYFDDLEPQQKNSDYLIDENTSLESMIYMFQSENQPLQQHNHYPSQYQKEHNNQDHNQEPYHQQYYHQQKSLLYY